MDSKELVREWFEKWEEGDFLDLPISENFKHTSPYGTITGKKQYIDLIEANRDKFLGHRFKFYDEIYGKNRACVRYTALKEDFTLDVTEWHYFKDGQIERIVAYYNIEGEISDERKLSMPE